MGVCVGVPSSVCACSCVFIFLYIHRTLKQISINLYLVVPLLTRGRSNSTEVKPLQCKAQGCGFESDSHYHPNTVNNNCELFKL